MQNRNLRIALLASHKRTGQLLSTVKHLSRTEYDSLILQHNISAHDADLCIDLYSQWELVMAAEQWGFEQGWTSPTTPEDAIGRAHAWKQAHHLH